jgi:hypothetical protein
VQIIAGQLVSSSLQESTPPLGTHSPLFLGGLPARFPPRLSGKLARRLHPRFSGRLPAKPSAVFTGILLGTLFDKLLAGLITRFLSGLIGRFTDTLTRQQSSEFLSRLSPSEYGQRSDRFLFRRMPQPLPRHTPTRQCSCAARGT